jgi:hypothetical protein
LKFIMYSAGQLSYHRNGTPTVPKNTLGTTKRVSN